MNSASNSLYTLQRFLFLTLDPVHVGTGGYRLGRVDMSITREPGTNLPKIPGTSLAGAARSYAAMRYGKPDAAGQHKKLKGGKANCPIIYTFGTTSDTGGGQAGTVSIGDARILFFPVNSMAGPVWVTTTECLREAWGSNSYTIEPADEGQAVISLNYDKEQINLGWLLLHVKPGLQISPPNGISECAEWQAITNRIVLVTPKLFSAVVNSNLEVRTSVSINPETGAAEEGALFTYEAIPRAAWLWYDVVEDCHRPKANVFPVSKKCKIELIKNGDGNEIKQYQENEGEELGEIWERPLDVVRSGLKLAEYLGVGGMNTRGFGRIKHIIDWSPTV